MFKIVSDSGCDLTKDEIKQHDIHIVPFYISLNGNDFLKEEVDITKDDFFAKLVADKKLFPKTSQPNPQDYIDTYEPLLKAGLDVLALTISSGASGSHASAVLAKTQLEEEYPERTIIVLDSLCGSVAQGLILKEIAKIRALGKTIQETAVLAEQVIKTAKLYITVDNLEYMKKGGRIGPTTAMVGSVLGLRPVLHAVNGKIEQLDSVRGRKKTLQLIGDAMAGALSENIAVAEISVGHIMAEDEATGFKEDLEKRLGATINNPVASMGATLGAHAGPGAMVFAYCKSHKAFL